MVLVKLSQEVIDAVTTIAQRRNAENRAAGQADGLVDHAKGSIAVDVEGALGEYAVARAFGLEWDGAFKDYDSWQAWRSDGHDVSGLEVRTTRHANGRLIVQPWNDDEKPYVLVVLRSDTEADVVGWCWGFQAKQDHYWRHNWPRPTYAVEQSALSNIEDLKKVWNGIWWLSTERMTGGVLVVNGVVSPDACTPIFKRFIGQPFRNLVKWLGKQPGFKSKYEGPSIASTR